MSVDSGVVFWLFFGTKRISTEAVLKRSFSDDWRILQTQRHRKDQLWLKESTREPFFSINIQSLLSSLLLLIFTVEDATESKCETVQRKPPGSNKIFRWGLQIYSPVDNTGQPGLYPENLSWKKKSKQNKTDKTRNNFHS